jgi:hypothetical protein
MPSTPPAAPTTVTVGRASELTGAYHAELDRLLLSANTRRAYRTRVAGFLAWLVTADLDGGDPLTDLHARDYAVRDYTRQAGHLLDPRHRQVRPRRLPIRLHKQVGEPARPETR